MDISVEKLAGTGSLTMAAAREIEKCVHCGFCTAACPTYSLDRNELDSPRGRIYLVKRLFEEGTNAKSVQLHLDRCLSCRSCEPACPSGVGYATIAHAGREAADKIAPRKTRTRIARSLMAEAFRNRTFCRLGRLAVRASGPLAPRGVRKAMSRSPAAGVRAPAARHGRKVAVLAGCAQAGLMPTTNEALAVLLDQAGYDASFLKAPCCGAIRMHNGRDGAALADARRTVQECASAIKAGTEAVLVAASGCGSFMNEYPALLADDKSIADDARLVAENAIDPASFLLGRLGESEALAGAGARRKVAAHAPCTLTNGMRSPKDYPELLSKAGFDVVELENPPNCCGSAGTYSLLQPRFSKRLRARMARSVEATAATELATANIGCAMHMRQALQMPVNHWIDILVAGMARAQSGD